ncbi:hypothetical protein R6Q59_022561 [Mikania micrantha]|uniref:Cytochrome P450 n=1 Tax=Mikania micrantha TaxID=192012 RepID=A0A5N6N015_9ASTR|nr:hypothetical protein E3N88_27593 [Mikania micrantha]
MVTIMVSVLIAVVITLIGKWGWKVLNWAWLKPKKLEKWLTEQGYKGNSYKVLIGDMKEFATTMKGIKSKHISVSHDIVSHVLPFDHHIITKYGKRSYIWVGPIARIYITDPELIKNILSRPNDFQKPHPEPIRDSITGGLLILEGSKWAKHRQIINPAFHLENIKSMFSVICWSCSDMIKKWELLTAGTGCVEVDVWPYIDNLAGDVISRTAFGSCYEEGHKIFRIQKQQIDLVLQLLFTLNLPGGRFIPTRANKMFKENGNNQRALLMSIIDKRKKAIEMGEDSTDDLLGILLKSNTKEIEEDGVGMSMEDVIQECKLFYAAGSETTSNLIAWTIVCLSLDQEWQTRARDEILTVFGTQELHFEGLKHLKILTMILNEVLRLYPPAIMVIRATHKETRLGDMMIPSGVHLTIPILNVHHDPEIWGEDATRFKPERFLEGIAGATKGKGSSCFLPFGGGPRVCIGQNFAMIEAKVAIAKILRRFSFELSSSYKHSPFPSFTLPPQFGVHLVLRMI